MARTLVPLCLLLAAAALGSIRAQDVVETFELNSGSTIDNAISGITIDARNFDLKIAYPKSDPLNPELLEKMSGANTATDSKPEESEMIPEFIKIDKNSPIVLPIAGLNLGTLKPGNCTTGEVGDDTYS